MKILSILKSNNKNIRVLVNIHSINVVLLTDVTKKRHFSTRNERGLDKKRIISYNNVLYDKKTKDGD